MYQSVDLENICVVLVGFDNIHTITCTRILFSATAAKFVRGGVVEKFL